MRWNSSTCMLEPLRGLLYQIGAFLPRLLLALAILRRCGWLLAKAVRFALVSARCAR